MPNIDEFINIELDSFIRSIQDDMQRKGIDTTGTASQSLQKDKKNNSYIVSGIFYFYWLDKGRAPGKFPPVDKILEWVRKKPVRFSYEGKQLTEDQIAYLIGRSLKENGSRIYRNNALGIELDKKIEQLTINLNEKLPNFVKQEVINRLNKAFTS